MKIAIKGTICTNDDKEIYEWYGVTSTAPKDVIDKLKEASGQNVDIYINSGGGEITSAMEIYSALREYNGNIQIHVVGMAASAASVIMCAAKCDINPTALVMIHNVSSYTSGDYNEMNKKSQVLQTADRAMCQAYIIKTGRTEKELLEMMNKETWFTADEAVAFGLCDSITESHQLIASYCTILTMEQRKKYSEHFAIPNIEHRIKKMEEKFK